MCAFFFGGFNRSLEISNVVECIKNSQNINAVCNRFLHKILHQIVCIMAVAKHILASVKHLQLCVGHSLADNSESLPWVFIQKTNARIKSCTAPNLSGIKANFIHCGQNIIHLIHAHTGCYQRLMSVTKHGFGNF